MPNINDFHLTPAEKAALQAARISTDPAATYAKSPYYNAENGQAFERALRNHIKNGRKGGVWRAHAGGDTYTTLRSKLYCGKAWLAANSKDPEILELLPRIKLKSDKNAGTMKMTEVSAAANIYKSVDGFTAFTSDAEQDLADLKARFITWAESAADGDLFDVSNLDLSDEDMEWFNNQKDELGLFGRVERGRIMVGMARGPANSSEFQGEI